MDALSRLAAMPGTCRLSGVLAAAATAVALTGCGSDGGGEIPAADANQLLSQLDAVESAVAQGDCTTATEAANGFAAQVDQLPADTFSDSNVRSKLVAASANLVGLVPLQCEQGTTGASGETGTVEQTSTTEATTSTTTTTTDTTEEPPAPDEESDPPGNSENAPGHNKDEGGDDDSGGIGSDG